MKFFVVFALLNLVFISPAYAYLDPGTGSMVIQMAIAGVLSVAFAIKTYWYKIKSIITGTKLEELDDLDDFDDLDGEEKSQINQVKVSEKEE